MSYNPKDHYFKKAKKENFAARSVFKLEEIDSRLRIVKTGQNVLDLGASPGSWSQYCSKKIGTNGKILGIDLTEIKIKLPNAIFVQADIRDANLESIFQQHGFTEPFDLVLSDMAPKTTGIRITDQARSMELCELALSTACRFLKPGGHFVCKLFHSDEFSNLRDQIKKHFEKFEAIKPDSTRKISKEIFLIGIRKKT
jgi:23S rRNA (uridine2552-2'-O)-methyltransferase